MKTKPQMGW